MAGLYIHIPFCERKCFYCSFVVSVGQTQRMDAYINALSREAEFYRGQAFDTVFIGGGTPTLLAPKQLILLFSIVRRYFDISSVKEWTIEANPEGVDGEKLSLLKNLGVTRLSLGVQSFNEKYLKYLGRIHGRDQAVAAYQAVREAGFDNVNVDMMFGFPNQTLEELEQDIQDFMALNSDHMSLYELTIEEPSRFFVKNVKGLDGPLRQKQYEIVLNRLQEYGFKQYEISNFAQPGKQSAHNRNYWQGGDYLGLGVGAHSHTSGKRGWNVSRLADYLQRLAQAQPVIEEEETLTESQRLAETLLFGLRMNEGVDVPYLEKRFGCVLNDGQKEKIGVFVKENLLVQQGAQLSVSAKGRFVLDELSVQLMPS